MSNFLIVVVLATLAGGGAGLFFRRGANRQRLLAVGPWLLGFSGIAILIANSLGERSGLAGLAGVLLTTAAVFMLSPAGEKSEGTEDR